MMSLLIDGYNLLYVAGIPSRGRGIGALERSRLGLLRFLVETLEPAELARTTVVFDAHEAPPGLPRTFEYHGITVHFAAKYENADALIEELVQADRDPKQLTVVSSDHQVQRAARRRHAKAIDSDVWHDEVVKRHTHRAEHVPKKPTPAKPSAPLMADEVSRWLEEFGGEKIVDEVLAEEFPRAAPSRAAHEHTSPPGSKKVRRATPQGDEKPADPLFDNPFPPGYAEDLEERL